jgi:preprotein translocase SecE subunit
MAIEKTSAKAGAGSGAGSPEQNLQRTSNFLKETYVELQKTKWPTSHEAWQLTSIVLAVIIVLGIFMGGMDFLLTALVAKFSLIK